MKRSAVLVCDVPDWVITVMSTVPAEWAGLGTVIDVDEFTVKFGYVT